MGMAAEVEEAKLRRDNRLEGVPLFYLRGGYAPEKLTGFYRAMMAPMAGWCPGPRRRRRPTGPMPGRLPGRGRLGFPERLAPVLAWLDGD